MNRTTPFLRTGAATKDRIRLFLRLTPNSSKDEIFGVEDGPNGPHFKARVRAQPEKGKANTALIKLVAKWLKAPKSGVVLKSGARSHIKTIELEDDSGELYSRVLSQYEALS